MLKEIGRIVDHRGNEKPIFAPKLVPETPKENIIFCPDKKEIRVDWRRNFELLELTSLYQRELEIVQETARVNVPADYPHLPILLWLPSDMHIGSLQTDHELIRNHMDLVIGTPNCFAAFVGDDIDNGIWWGLSGEQAIPPYMQSFTVRDMAEELGGRNERKRPLVLARVSGNHTDWVFSKTGQSWEDIWYSNTKAPVFPGIGQLFLKHREQEYELALAHMYWGRSKLNPTNACKRLIEHEYPNADMAVVAHDHITETLEFNRGGKTRIAVRSGTYKLTDFYARKHGIALRGQRGGAGVMFWPNERKMMAFSKLEDGIDFLSRLM